MEKPFRRWNLLKARKRRGWSVTQAAEAVGICPGYYSLLETAQRRPSLVVALQFERAFGVPAGQLFPDVFDEEVKPRGVRHKRVQPSTGTDN